MFRIKPSLKNFLSQYQFSLKQLSLVALGSGLTAVIFFTLGASPPNQRPRESASVVTPGKVKLVPVIENGVRTYELKAEPIRAKFYPEFNRGGLKAFGYNGQTPGPTLEAIQGEPIRIRFTNQLSEPTTIHWHGVEVPNKMDGAGGINQEPIAPGKTFVYEFTPPRSGTFMYHSGTSPTRQVNMGLAGMFLVHPKNSSREIEAVDRDYALLLQIWKVPFHSNERDLLEMANYSHFTFNGLAGPAIPELVARLGERVRIRIGNLSELAHPVHLHGFSFWVTGTDGGWIPKPAQWPQATILVGGGETRTIEFEIPDSVDRIGVWPLHCHFLHHIMNDMDLPMLPGSEMKMEEHGGMFTRLRILPKE